MKSHEYVRLYKTARWQRTRAYQLAIEPLCRMCQARNQMTAATVCDHITPHKGNEALFWNGPFQSLCKQCHDSDKQRIEKGKAPKPTIGADGWPIS